MARLMLPPSMAKAWNTVEEELISLATCGPLLASSALSWLSTWIRWLRLL